MRRFGSLLIGLVLAALVIGPAVALPPTRAVSTGAVTTAGAGLSKTGSTLSLSTPVTTARGGTGLSSFTANCVFYTSSTSAIGQRCCSDGQVIVWSSGVPTCGSAGGQSAVVAELRTITNTVPSTRRWGYQGALTTVTTNGSIALGRIKLPAGTYTLTATVSSILAAGQTLAISVYSCATVNGTYAEATGGSGATVTFVDSDAAEAERSATFTLASPAWVLFSTLYSSGTYLGYIVAQIRTGS